MLVMSHNSAIRRVQHNLVIHTQRYIQDVLNKSELLKVADMQKQFRYQAAALATRVLNPGRNKQYLCADVWKLYNCFYANGTAEVTNWLQWYKTPKYHKLQKNSPKSCLIMACHWPGLVESQNWNVGFRNILNVARWLCQNLIILFIRLVYQSEAGALQL